MIVLVLGLLVAACGSDDDSPAKAADAGIPPDSGTTPPPDSSGTSEGGTPSNCEVLVPNRSPTWVDSFFGIGIYTGLSNTGDVSYEDGIGIRLRTGYGYLDDIPPYEQVPGTFDLGEAVENDYRTCRHCVFALVDVSGDHIQRLFLAQSGELVLTSIDIDTGEAVGYVQDVVLAEIEATGYYAWGGPISGGECRSIPRLDFDTRAIPGSACTDVEDCPNAELLRCEGGICVE